MAHYVTFNIDTGEKTGESAADPGVPAAGHAVRVYETNPGGTWDPAALEYAVPATKVQVEAARLREPYEAWQRWKTTHTEAVARSLPAATVTALLNRTNAAWTDYAQAIADWRAAT